MKAVYLDYNASTPLDLLVAEAMQPFLWGMFGNPSSSHEYGIEARLAVESARAKLSLLLNAHPDEIIFTGGGTEANNLALKGFAFAHAGKGRHIITSAVEHPAVLEVCRFLGSMGFEISTLQVDSYGMVDPDGFTKAIRPGTILASIMHANNEVGTIQPLEEIGRICRQHGIVFHTDAAQSVGKIPVDVRKLNVDLLSVAGHKVYAPKGIGALFCRRGVKLWKMMHGAGHEQGLRAGTENVMGIVGLGKAAELCTMYDVQCTNDQITQSSGIQDLQSLRNRLQEGILEAFPDAGMNGHPVLRLPNTLSMGFRGKDASALLNSWKGLAASAGAACHAGMETISPVLLAMKVPREYALGTIRFSVGRMTTEDDIGAALEIISGRNDKATSMFMAGWHTDEKVLTGIPQDIQPGDGTKTAPSSAIDNKNIKLTAYTHALGCACKINPIALGNILKSLPKPSGNKILVGTETSDDAAVYLIGRDNAIVQTVDFIPPVVDDPYSFGAIAAANALSDIWAMGGRPLFALSIVAFPEKLLPAEVLMEILRGAADKAAEAGISIIGGHSIEDQEPKFGLVVCGEVHPGKIWKNSTPQAGDALILTKPLGSGIISTAVKRAYASPEAAGQAAGIMSELNKKAAEILMDFEVHACTDVTGFGLLGHLKEMLSAGGNYAVLNWETVSLIPSAWDYAIAGMVPGGTLNNLEFVSGMLDIGQGVPEMARILFCDAQTSGGLLVAIPENQAEQAVSALKANGTGYASIIGKILRGNSRIRII